MKKLFLAGCALLVLAGTTAASTHDLDVQMNMSTTGPVPDDSKAARIKLASRALVYWKSFDDRIPRNSPAENEWLDRELKSKETSRVTKALNSPEIAIRNLTVRSDSCVKIFERWLRKATATPVRARRANSISG